MTSNQFFFRPENLLFPHVFLDGDDHHHLSRVVRMKPGGMVRLVDSMGRRYLARIVEIGRERTKLFLVGEEEREKQTVSLSLAQALIKGRKMEFIIQKSAEIGLTRFIPVISARSVVRVGERAEKKMERWRKIAREAGKQSKGSIMPDILSPMTLERLFGKPEEERKLFLRETGGKPLREILLLAEKDEQESLPSSVLIFVGPEGGWTEKEETLILDGGFEPVSLGNRVLRSETASLCAMAMVSLFWNS